MKKLSIFLASLVAFFLLPSCSTYYAYRNDNKTMNLNMTQTQVVLSSNNFRVVKVASAIVNYEYNNDNYGAPNNKNVENLRNSAYAQLLRNANLQGSQALVNVTLEEIYKEIYGGTPISIESVKAQGVVIEFIDPTKEPQEQVSAPTPPVASSIDETAIPTSQRVQDTTSVVAEVPQQESISGSQTYTYKPTYKDEYYTKYFAKKATLKPLYIKLAAIIDTNKDTVVAPEEYQHAADVMGYSTIDKFIKALIMKFDAYKEDAFLKTLQNNI